MGGRNYAGAGREWAACQAFPALPLASRSSLPCRRHASEATPLVVWRQQRAEAGGVDRRVSVFCLESFSRSRDQSARFEAAPGNFAAFRLPARFTFHSRVYTAVGFYRKTDFANLIESGAE